jgi:hypothetical protein
MLRILRQRAASELFEWLGLEQIPKGYWTLLDRMGDPSRALIAFISNNRFDSTLVRKRDPTELTAFRNFVRFVCHVEEATDLVSERQRILLDRYMYYGEHANARNLVESFVAVNEAVELFERSPGQYRFAAFAMHARRVATLRENAPRLDLQEAKALLGISRGFAHVTRRFRSAADRSARVVAAVRERWGTLSQDDRTVCAALLARLVQIEHALRDDADCDVREEVDDFERHAGRLAALADEFRKRARDAVARHAAAEHRRREEQARREEARRQQEQRTAGNEGRARPDLDGREVRGLSRDELLSIFGFPPGAAPGLSVLRRAFIREANGTLPVPGQPDYRERNDRYRFLKESYERLKIGFG